MGTYRIKTMGVYFTEEQLANLYFEHHPEVDAVTTLCLLSWAKTHFKSDLMKVYEAELVY